MRSSTSALYTPPKHFRVWGVFGGRIGDMVVLIGCGSMCADAQITTTYIILLFMSYEYRYIIITSYTS